MKDNSVQRLLPDTDEADPPTEKALAVMREMWLDNLEAERDAVIMRLRQIDKTLVRYGRLKTETLNRR